MESQSVQQDVRSAYLRRSVAQTILGIFWLTAVALGTWGKESYAIVMIVLHLMGRPAGLPVLHPMNQLIFGIALIIPFSLRCRPFEPRRL